MEAVAMKIAKLLSGYFVGSLLFLGVATLLFGPGSVQASTEKSFHASTTILPDNPGAAAVTQEKASRQESFGHLPLYFIANRGQVDRKVQFYAQGPGQRLAFTSREAVLSLSQGKGKLAKIHLIPVGIKPGITIQALDPQAARFNYLLGKDQSRWHTDVPSYGAVLYREAYPGIDLKFYGNGRELEYDLIVRPGADLSRVKFRYGGIAGLKVDNEGNLAIRLRNGGRLLQKKPVVYQEIDGRRVAREGRFRLLKPGGTEYGVVVASYDKRRHLVIDPALVYSTVFGTGYTEWTQAIAVDGTGNAYVTGNATSSGLPLKPDPPICTYKGGQDVFVIKFNQAGNTMLYSTYLGGTADDAPWSIAVDGTGQAYVTGQTQSVDFITTPTSLHPNPLGGGDCFVSKINTAGTALVYSTYLGGPKDDTAACITADGAGNAYVTGQTRSDSDFTTLKPMHPWAGAPTDAFVAKLNANGTAMLNFTYLGGSLPDTKAADGGNGIGLDQAGNIYIAGYTSSEDFPRVNAFQNSKGGGTHDAFVAKIDAAWTGLVYSTYLGGSSNDYGQAIAVNGMGSAYVVGATQSSNFPTKGSLQPYRGGVPPSSNNNAFVTKLSPSGRALVYSTFLGGTHSAYSIYHMALDRNGHAYAAGGTSSVDFPVKNALQPELSGASDGFVTKIATPDSGAAVDLLLLMRY